VPFPLFHVPFTLQLSKTEGTITSLKYKRVELVESGLRPDFWRAPIDNDWGNGMPRFGMQMTIPGGFEEFNWYGRGPWESYIDRQDASPIGVYRRSVDGLFVDYSRPQENGNLTDVRWITLTNRQGVGLLVVGMPLLSVSARHYATADLENAAHTHEMTRRKAITLNLDHRQMGVGGDNSWGARTHAEFLLTEKSYGYQFRLRPFTVVNGRSPSQLARQVVQ